MGKQNNRQIVEEVSLIKRKFEDQLTSKDLEWLEDHLVDSLHKLTLKGSVGKEVLADFLFQKTPPHNVESEAALLGKLILFPSKIMTQCTSLTRDHFYDSRNAWIWAACKEVNNKGKSITLDAVYSFLEGNSKTDSAGGKRYIEALVKDQTSDTGFLDRLKEVQDNFVLRGIWGKCAEAVHDVMNIDADNAHDFRIKIIEELSALSQQQTAKYHTGSSMAVEMAEYIERYEEAIIAGDGLTGNQSCVGALDSVTKGWHKTDLIIVAARPGMGKTALAISDAAVAVLAGIPVAFFSLEMSALQLTIRLFCVIKGYSLELALKYKRPDLDRFISDELPNLPIYIDDTPGVHWKYILDRSMAMKEKHGIQMIYVDYLQLMSGVDSRVSNRENIVGENSRGLKIIAKTTECPVMALSQLSRSCESRIDKRPMLSDLRDSGSIEQDADMVIFTYRPEYYKIFEDDYGTTEGIGELIIAKHRNGALDTVKAFFNAPITKWTDLKNRPMTYTNNTNQNLKKKVEYEEERIDEGMPF